MRAAPSYVTSPSGLAPAAVLRRLLTRFGDRRFVRRIELASPPPRVSRHLKGWFAGQRPPGDALWAYLAVPALAQRAHVAAEAGMIAEWEASLVGGAIRDELCAAGGPPLVGWTVVGGGAGGVSDLGQALGQRFPNPSPAAFRSRLRAVGRRFGFTVESLRLLRPLQLAPLLVVRTGRDRKALVRDVPAIMRLLDPVASGRRQPAVTFEGFFFEARDGRGAFVRVENVYRGQVEGGQWSWNRCVYPYAHSEPVSAKPCPR
jgi:hypothetical protein